MTKFLTLIASAGLCLLSLLQFAWAGDFAERHIYGFSMDGGLFAFEEYGVQDGSGFPYSNIYVIDTTTDTWTAGSPFRVQLNDETKSVFDAREEAEILAGTVLKSFEDRGQIVATNRSSERGIDTKRMVAVPRIVEPPIDDEIEFRLQPLVFPASGNCIAFNAGNGFRLLQISNKGGEETRILHEDTSVPDSRNCPLEYSFADLITYFPEGGTPVVAILILMRTVGFEGPDGRYIAVTSALQ